MFLHTISAGKINLSK